VHLTSYIRIQEKDAQNMIKNLIAAFFTVCLFPTIGNAVEEEHVRYPIQIISSHPIIGKAAFLIKTDTGIVRGARTKLPPFIPSRPTPPGGEPDYWTTWVLRSPLKKDMDRIVGLRIIQGIHFRDLFFDHNRHIVYLDLDP
jgi:hypothetical protein